MARYTGPKDRISRRFLVPLFGSSRALERRNYPPGQHGLRAGRRKKSDYAIALGEKQKLKFQYGVLEKQFRRCYEEAAKRRGVTGDILLQLLETRLDNVCFRLGFGNTRQAARLLVGHGHVLVNGHKLDGLRMMDLTQAIPLKDWLALDRETMEGVVARLPEVEDIDPLVNVQLIVELYSR
jgi:small subunit ribosomal protein S4